MSVYRTAMGKPIDMAALAAKNENVRAVGNMRVNARGDLLDDAGNVIKTATQRANETYAKTVGNRSSQVVKNKPVAAKPTPPAPKVDLAELNLEEQELELNQDLDKEIEEIKAKELKK
jgi:hypothetical protein